MLDIVVSGGTAVLPSGAEPADIGIQGEKIAAIVQDSYKQIGVGVDIRTLEWAAYLSALRTEPCGEHNCSRSALVTL